MQSIGVGEVPENGLPCKTCTMAGTGGGDRINELPGEVGEKQETKLACKTCTMGETGRERGSNDFPYREGRGCVRN